jgi:hypothetical protein
MKIKTILSLSTAFGLMLISGGEILAQSANQQPTPFQSNEQNPLYGDGINPLQLIHNANFFNSRSGSEFMEDTNQNLDRATQDFKKQQQERMLQQMQNRQQSINSETKPEQL